MHKVNDYIIYKRNVCKITNILPKYFHNTDYYILCPISDNTLTIKIPTNNKDIRNLLTINEIDKLISSIPNIKIIDSNTRELESIYKKLLQTGLHEDLIKIIKTTYIRNKDRLDNNKKTTDKDTYYFNLAEEYLYNEIATVLNISFDDAKEYVINKVSKLCK